MKQVLSLITNLLPVIVSHMSPVWPEGDGVVCAPWTTRFFHPRRRCDLVTLSVTHRLQVPSDGDRSFINHTRFHYDHAAASPINQSHPTGGCMMVTCNAWHAVRTGRNLQTGRRDGCLASRVSGSYLRQQDTRFESGPVVIMPIE